MEYKESANYLKSKGIENCQVGIILGTGLGKLIDEMDIIKKISYPEIPHFPVSTVESHQGYLVYGSIAGKKVIAMQGRFHYYEGYTMKQITFPIRVMKLLGIKYLLISNASGAINLNFKKGELMMITDHINLQPDNPLIGKNQNEFGVRFPDMSNPYSEKINNKLSEIAGREKLTLHKGVYASVTGPNLETKAEYKYLKIIGADAVGMSTVPEVIVANHMKLPCSAVSVITDECNPENLMPVDISEILEAAAKAEGKLTKLFTSLIKEIDI